MPARAAPGTSIAGGGALSNCQRSGTPRPSRRGRAAGAGRGARPRTGRPHAAAVAALARMTMGSSGRHLLAQLLQALGDVHRVADQRVVEPVAGADVADQGRAGVQAEAQPQRRERLRSRGAGRGSASAARTARAAWSGCGTGAPQNAIIPSPRNLSTVPSVSPTQPASSSKCWFEQARRLCASSCSARREKPDDVGEQHRHLELARGHHVGRRIVHELAAPAGAARRSRTRRARCAWR